MCPRMLLMSAESKIQYTFVLKTKVGMCHKWNAGQAYSPSYIASGKGSVQPIPQTRKLWPYNDRNDYACICADPGSASGIYSLLAVGVRGQRSGNRRV